MKITSHRELEVWREAMDLAMEVFDATKRFPTEERYSLTDHSVPSSPPLLFSCSNRMTASAVITALGLPPESLVNQRVPKKLLLENGAPTAGDKRKIQEGIEELLWVAALKPANIGVPLYRDTEREYLEVAVLVLTLRPPAKGQRLVELIHRAIPYPVFLISVLGAMASISVAHKRWSQAEHERTVVDAVVTSTPFSPTALTPDEAGFLGSLAVAQMPRSNLFALYQSWHDRLAALEAAQIRGAFVPPASAEKAVALREALDAHAGIRTQIVAIRAQAEHETQINRRVELNLEIKRLEAELTRIITAL